MSASTTAFELAGQRNWRQIQTLSCSLAITMTSTTTVSVATLSY